MKGGGYGKAMVIACTCFCKDCGPEDSRPSLRPHSYITYAAGWNRNKHCQREDVMEHKVMRREKVMEEKVERREKGRGTEQGEE